MLESFGSLGGSIEPFYIMSNYFKFLVDVGTHCLRGTEKAFGKTVSMIGGGRARPTPQGEERGIGREGEGGGSNWGGNCDPNDEG